MMSIDEFIESMKADGIKHQAVGNARNTLEQLDRFKPLNEVTAIDINKFINHIKQKHDYSDGTISIRKVYIKKYFTLNEKDEIVKNVKATRPRKALDPADIITVDDVNTLIKVTQSPMYRALLSVLWESGGRINEILSINKERDLIENDYGFEVKIFASKTAGYNNGYRKMILIDSAPYIREWQVYNNKKSEKLFPIGSRAVRKTLDVLKLKTGIKKPLNPHAFRHGAATRLVKTKVQESIIRKQLGWAPDSKMISTYVHLNDEDVINDQLTRSGVMTPDCEPVTAELIKPVESIADKYQKQAAELAEMKAQMSEMEKTFNDPTVVEALIEKRLNEILKTNR